MKNWTLRCCMTACAVLAIGGPSPAIYDPPQPIAVLLSSDDGVKVNRTAKVTPVHPRDLFAGDRIVVPEKARARFRCVGDRTPTELTVAKMPADGSGYPVACPLKPCRTASDGCATLQYLRLLAEGYQKNTVAAGTADLAWVVYQRESGAAVEVLQEASAYAALASDRTLARVDDEARRAIEEVRREIDASDAPPATKAVMTALLYRSWGLYLDAARSLDSVAAASPTPSIDLLAGQFLVSGGARPAALERFRRAIVGFNEKKDNLSTAVAVLSAVYADPAREPDKDALYVRSAFALDPSLRYDAVIQSMKPVDTFESFSKAHVQSLSWKDYGAIERPQ